MNVKEMLEKRNTEKLAGEGRDYAGAVAPAQAVQPVFIEEGTFNFDPIDHGCGAGRSLVKRLTEMAKEKRCISFIVLCPGTTHNRIVHSVQMKDFEVKKTAEGKYVVTGRDLEQEIRSDIVEERVIAKRAHRRKDQCVFRSYRVDRIVKRTLFAK